jgi:hypothetical protein
MIINALGDLLEKANEAYSRAFLLNLKSMGCRGITSYK